jgi:hypothetical protein
LGREIKKGVEEIQRLFAFRIESKTYPLIASAGQTPTQEPQSVHFAASITYFPSPSEIASDGHSGAHAPQDRQSSLIL